MLFSMICLFSSLRSQLELKVRFCGTTPSGDRKWCKYRDGERECSFTIQQKNNIMKNSSHIHMKILLPLPSLDWKPA